MMHSHAALASRLMASEPRKGESLDCRDEDDAFLQQLILSEEDRQRRHPTTRWTGGYRWFRSPNVVPLEKYREAKQRP